MKIVIYKLYKQFFYFFLNLFISAAPGLSCSTWDLCCGMFSRSMQTLSCSMHVGSSLPTKNRTRVPCIGSAVLPTGPTGKSLYKQFFTTEVTLSLFYLPLWFLNSLTRGKNNLSSQKPSFAKVALNGIPASTSDLVYSVSTY